MSLSLEQVLALAPDASSAAAGRKLGTPAPWQTLGGNDDAYWGECKGSALYQVRVARHDLAAKCSCPSRKFPCKHALGLLVLAATAPTALSATEPPEWVIEWLVKRGESMARKAARQERAADAEPADPAAQERRAAKRLDRVLQGLDAFDLWMNDLVRNGLGAIEAQGPSLWMQQASRMVDAQAPGIAARLRRLADLPGRDGWTERLLGELGSLALLTHALRRVDQLDSKLQDDVRQLVGWTVEQAEVYEKGEKVADQWAIIGQSVEDEDRLKVQRNWLVGISSGRPALVLQFSAAKAPFAAQLMPGTRFEADLSFFPSALPLRAVIGDRRGTPQPLDQVPAAGSIEDLLGSWSRALAGLPWLDRYPAALRSVTPLRDGRAGWYLRDEGGATLPLARGDHWLLLALSGGHPINVAGEWDGSTILPLGAVAGGRYRVVGRAS
jgi:SWIM zinc finger